jgi:hypothetical protein
MLRLNALWLTRSLRVHVIRGIRETMRARYLGSLLLIFALAAPALSQSQDRRGGSLDRVLPHVRQSVPGTFYDAEGPFFGDDGKPTYRLKWMTPDNRIIWFSVDAQSGRVLDRPPSGPPQSRSRGGDERPRNDWQNGWDNRDRSNWSERARERDEGRGNWGDRGGWPDRDRGNDRGGWGDRDRGSDRDGDRSGGWGGRDRGTWGGARDNRDGNRDGNRGGWGGDRGGDRGGGDRGGNRGGNWGGRSNGDRGGSGHRPRGG